MNNRQFEAAKLKLGKLINLLSISRLDRDYFFELELALSSEGILRLLDPALVRLELDKTAELDLKIAASGVELPKFKDFIAVSKKEWIILSSRVSVGNKNYDRRAGLGKDEAEKAEELADLFHKNKEVAMAFFSAYVELVDADTCCLFMHNGFPNEHSIKGSVLMWTKKTPTDLYWCGAVGYGNDVLPPIRDVFIKPFRWFTVMENGNIDIKKYSKAVRRMIKDENEYFTISCPWLRYETI